MEFEGKTVEEAIKLGLTAYGVTEEQAEITVIRDAKKGLFGKIKQTAMVELKVKEQPKINEVKKQVVKENAKSNKAEKVNIESASKFVKEVVKLLGIDSTVEVGSDGENPVIILKTEKSSFLIGRRGEVIDAVQTLACAVANVGNNDYKKVVVDCENYRNKREETLISLAHKLENKANEIKREVVLEPMMAFERRIIHTALAESTLVTTRSDGKEPNRYVVIVPNNLEASSKPYIAARKENGRQDKKHNNKGHNRDNKMRNFNKKPFEGEKKKSSSFSFGTYLGNSMKDENK